jgi:hypothetical protein
VKSGESQAAIEKRKVEVAELAPAAATGA